MATHAADPTIVFLDSEALAPGIELPPLPFAHDLHSHVYTDPEQVVERLQGATVALTCSVPLRKEHLRQLPTLKMISLALTGSDIVDLDHCREAGIMVTNVPGYAANTVAEHAMGMIFTLLRRIGAYDSLMGAVARGEQAPRNIYLDYRVRDVAGRRLGIVGQGAIGKRLGDIARCLGMDVRFDDRDGRNRRDDTLPFAELLATSDVVSLHVPLTDRTRDLISHREIATMKRDAIIINTARGGIVNEGAIIAALEERRLGGVGLDVTAHEPVQPDDPLMSLVGRDDFILNPHVAWSSQDAMQSLIDRACGHIVQFMRGETPAATIVKAQ